MTHCPSLSKLTKSRQRSNDGEVDHHRSGKFNTTQAYLAPKALWSSTCESVGQSFQDRIELEEANKSDTDVVAVFCILAFAAATNSSLLFPIHSRAFRKAVTPRRNMFALPPIPNMSMKVIRYSVESPEIDGLMGR